MARGGLFEGGEGRGREERGRGWIGKEGATEAGEKGSEGETR